MRPAGSNGAVTPGSNGAVTPDSNAWKRLTAIAGDPAQRAVGSSGSARPMQRLAGCYPLDMDQHPEDHRATRSQRSCGKRS